MEDDTMARLRATSGPGTRDHTLFLKPPPLDSAGRSSATAAKAYPAESGYCFPLFPTSGPVGDRHRKPKPWSAILGGPGFDSSSAAFKSAARPTVAVT